MIPRTLVCCSLLNQNNKETHNFKKYINSTPGRAEIIKIKAMFSVWGTYYLLDAYPATSMLVSHTRTYKPVSLWVKNPTTNRVRSESDTLKNSPRDASHRRKSSSYTSIMVLPAMANLNSSKDSSPLWSKSVSFIHMSSCEDKYSTV